MFFFTGLCTESCNMYSCPCNYISLVLIQNPFQSLLFASVYSWRRGELGKEAQRGAGLEKRHLKLIGVACGLN